MEFKELQIKEFNNLDDKMHGIYVWYLKPKRLDDNKVLKLYEAFNKFEIKLSGNTVFNDNYKFGDYFKGKLTRNMANSDLTKKSISLDKEFIISFIKSNSMPLYIGRSINIKKRLNQHYEGYLYATSINFLATMNNDFDEDSDEESSYFGMRLARLNHDKWFNDNEMSISYYSKPELDYDSIKGIEFYLNRLYKPILGLI